MKLKRVLCKLKRAVFTLQRALYTFNRVTNPSAGVDDKSFSFSDYAHTHIWSIMLSVYLCPYTYAVQLCVSLTNWRRRCISARICIVSRSMHTYICNINLCISHKLMQKQYVSKTLLCIRACICIHMNTSCKYVYLSVSIYIRHVNVCVSHQSEKT